MINKQKLNKEDKEILGKVLECIRFADEHYQLEDEKINGVAVKAWLLNHINKMDNKTRIKFTETRYRYKAGETGYIDGYVMGIDSVPYAIVVKDSDNKFVLADLHNIIKI